MTSVASSCSIAAGVLPSRRARWLAAVGVLAATVAAGACGGDADQPSPPPNGVGGSGASAQAGSGGSLAANGGTGDDVGCVESECPNVNALGSVIPGCCQLSGVCGGLLSLMGTTFCAPPNVDEVTGTIGDRFEALPTETIVDDPECPSQTVFGTEVSGCCDQTGVCGLSTAELRSGPAATLLRIDVPLSCVAPDEAVQLGAGFGGPGTNGDPEPCGASAPAPSVDAGADGG